MEVTRTKRKGSLESRCPVVGQSLSPGLEGTQRLADMNSSLFLAVDSVCSQTFNSTNAY